MYNKNPTGDKLSPVGFSFLGKTTTSSTADAAGYGDENGNISDDSGIGWVLLFLLPIFQIRSGFRNGICNRVKSSYFASFYAQRTSLCALVSLTIHTMQKKDKACVLRR